jgi:hypothetical protein
MPQQEDAGVVFTVELGKVVFTTTLLREWKDSSVSSVELETAQLPVASKPTEIGQSNG